MRIAKLLNMGLAIGVLMGGLIRLFTGHADVYLLLALGFALTTLFVLQKAGTGSKA